MKKFLFAFATVALFSACGHKDDQEFKYQYTVNNCDTGEHKADSKAQYCSMLKDDGLNNGCAGDMRKQAASDQGC
jgi:hypothetical protein